MSFFPLKDLMMQEIRLYEVRGDDVLFTASVVYGGHQEILKNLFDSDQHHLYDSQSIRPNRVIQ